MGKENQSVQEAADLKSSFLNYAQLKFKSDPPALQEG